MATNPYVNKVVYGNDTVMDISDTDAQPSEVLRGKKFYLGSGAPATGTAIGGVPEEELRDTVGWTGKNLLPIEVESKTIQSVVFTVNSDGSINANGTASPEAVIWDICTNLSLKKGTYILSGCPSGASASTYELLINNGGTTYRDYGDGVEFTLDADTVLDNVRIIVRQNATISNQTFYPMLRDASITDDTYEPYHKDVDTIKANREEIVDAVGWSGKNRFDYHNIMTGEANATINADGSSIQISATGTYKLTAFKMTSLEPNTDYIFTSDIDYTSGVAYVAVSTVDSDTEIVNSGQITTDRSVSVSFNTGNRTEVRIKLVCTWSTSETGDVTYNNSMLRKATISDSTFEPYHESVEVCKFNRSEQRVLGAKNLLPYPVGTRQTIASDGTITSSPERYCSDYLDMSNIDAVTFSSGVLTGTVYVRFAYYNSNKTFISRDLETVSSSNYSITKTKPANTAFVRVNFEDESSNMVTNPMLRLASDPDNTYAPYAMTNKELTDSLDGWTAASTVSNGSVSFSGLDDTNGWSYHPVFWVDGNSTNLNPTAELSTISGTGTSSMSVTYTTDADNGASCKLRIEK